MALIIIMLFLFYPVGIALMISKLHKEKENFINNAKSTTIIGWIFIGMGLAFTVLVVLGLMVDPTIIQSAEEMIYMRVALAIMILPLIGRGLYMVSQGRKYKELGKMYEKYRYVISGKSKIYIDEIAGSVNSSYDVVVKELEFLILKGVLYGGYIDKSSKMLVSPARYVGNNISHKKTTEEDRAKKSTSLKCPNCGGVNPANIIECEYCGTPL